MTIRARRAACVSVAALAGFALIQAATTGYYQKEAAIRKEAAEQLQKLGLTREAAKAKYPTPEIRMVSAGCLLPGGTGDVVVNGKFTPGTRFVLESDALEVAKESLTPAEYRASVKVAPGIPPHAAPVVAISPVSGISTYSNPGVAIGGKAEWDMEAANGWKVVARSPAGKTCGGPFREDTYVVQFFRKGEPAPFATRSARAQYSASSSTEYFTLGYEDPSADSQAKDFQALVQKMSDPKTPPAERQKLMAQLQKAQQQMMAAAQNAMKQAQEVEAQRKTFGCEHIELKLQGAAFTGTLRCAEAVGTRLALTGTMKSLER